MRATFDQRSDAVYIYLLEERTAGIVSRQYHVAPIDLWGMINLDYDVSGRLIGIEILGASKRLPQELLDQATRID